MTYSWIPKSSASIEAAKNQSSDQERRNIASAAILSAVLSRQSTRRNGAAHLLGGGEGTHERAISCFSSGQILGFVAY